MTSHSPDSSPSSAQLQDHLKAMRRTGLALGGMLVVFAISSFFLPRLANALVGPKGATLVATAAARWIGLVLGLWERSSGRKHRSREELS